MDLPGAVLEEEISDRDSPDAGSLSSSPSPPQVALVSPFLKLTKLMKLNNLIAMLIFLGSGCICIIVTQIQQRY